VNLLGSLMSEAVPRFEAATDLRLPMKTILSSKPDFIFGEKTVEFVWGPESDRFDRYVFYTYRLMGPGESDGKWSPFTAETQVFLSLHKSGRHRFEVKAMNRWYEIEKQISASHDFYYEPESSTEVDTRLNPLWTQPKKKPSSDEKSSVAKSEAKKLGQRISSPGPFGCGVHETQGSGGPFWLSLLTLLWWLSLCRWRLSRPGPIGVEPSHRKK
jgi:hypothetical protein